MLLLQLYSIDIDKATTRVIHTPCAFFIEMMIYYIDNKSY